MPLFLSATSWRSVRGQPDADAGFFDVGITSLHPPFVQVMADYNRIYQAGKTRCLQNGPGNRPDDRKGRLICWDHWNEQLAALAKQDPIKARSDFCPERSLGECMDSWKKNIVRLRERPPRRYVHHSREGLDLIRCIKPFYHKSPFRTACLQAEVIGPGHHYPIGTIVIGT